MESAMEPQRREKLVFLWGEGEYWRFKVMCELDLKEGTGVYKL